MEFSTTKNMPSKYYIAAHPLILSLNRLCPDLNTLRTYHTCIGNYLYASDNTILENFLEIEEERVKCSVDTDNSKIIGSYNICSTFVKFKQEQT